MKKIFLIGLAATAMLASCSNDETVEMAQQKAIGFSNAFVNNGTRSIVDPSFTTTSLEDFAVYGFTQNGQIFKGDKVHKGRFCLYRMVIRCIAVLGSWQHLHFRCHCALQCSDKCFQCSIA